MALKLYYSQRSPFARNVRILLLELGLDFEGDLLNAMRPLDEFGAINPGIAIPVLEDGERRLFDSKVIAQYLLEGDWPPITGHQQEPPLLRAWTREECKWDDLTLLSTLETLTEALVSTFMVRRSLSEAGLDAANLTILTRHEKRLSSLLDWLDDRATPQGFVPGSFSIFDIQLLSALSLADVKQVAEWRGRANLEAIVDRFSQRSSVVETISDEAETVIP